MGKDEKSTTAPPEISVIVPVYNGAEWLREALTSLAAQTYTDFETILVNDGSTDDSEEICREFACEDSRFRLLNQKNQGVSAARNHGLEKSRGEWVAFLDADDAFPPDALECLIGLAKENNADIAAGRILRGIPAKSPKQTNRNIIVNSSEALLSGLYQKRILNSPCGVLFHSSIFNPEGETGSSPLRFRNCRYEDLDLFYKAFERAERIALSDSVVYYYRNTPGSFINSWSPSRLDVLDVTERMVEHFRNGDPRLFRAACDRQFSAACNMLIEMLRYKTDERQQLLRCVDLIRRHRRAELRDPKVRLKNKIGALLSYPLLPVIKLLKK